MATGMSWGDPGTQGFHKAGWAQGLAGSLGDYGQMQSLKLVCLWLRAGVENVFINSHK